MGFYNKTINMVRRLEILFSVLFLLVGFLQNCSLTFGNSIISVVQWPTVALGGLLVLYRLFYNKFYIKTPVIWPLVAFVVSYVLSMVVNYKYGIYENFRGLIFLIFQIGLLYAFNFNEEKAFAKKKFVISAHFYIIVLAIMSLASLITMFFGVCNIYEQEVGPTIVVGFAWGRLFGVYWDPNIAAAMSAISVLLSILFLRNSRKIFKALYILNIVVQVLYIVFSASRTGVVGLTLALVIYFALYLSKYCFKKIKQKLLKGALVVLCVLLIGVAAFRGPNYIKNGYNALTEYIISHYDVETDNNILISSDGREEDIASDISNRRFDIWGSATQIFMSSPVFGASHNNIVPYTRENLPDAYILTNDHMIFYSMHNVIFDIMASQGILGVFSFGISALLLLVFIIMKRKQFFDGDSANYNFAMLSIIGTVLACSMFITEIVYVISPFTLIFWLSAGCLVRELSE